MHRPPAEENPKYPNQLTMLLFTGLSSLLIMKMILRKVEEIINKDYSYRYKGRKEKEQFKQGQFLVLHVHLVQ